MRGIGIIGADPCVCPADQKLRELPIIVPKWQTQGEHMESPLQGLVRDKVELSEA